MVTIYTWTASCNLAAPSGNFLCSRSGFAAACDGAAGACGCFAKLAATAAGWMCGERVIDFAARCGAQDEENVEHKNPLCGGLHPLQESDG